MGVPLAAVNRKHNVGRYEDDGEVGQRETWDPVSSRHRCRETSLRMRPSWPGREAGRCNPAALDD